MNKWNKLRFITLMLSLVCAPAWSQIIGPLPITLQNGTTADANQVMSDFNKIRDDVNTNAAPSATAAKTNVTNTFTSPQIMSGATALNHAVIASQVQQNALTFFTDTGAINAYVVTPAPAWVAYNAGSELFVKIGAGNTNTAGSTINVSILGAKNILNEDGSTLEANALQATRVYHLIYDGTQFLVNGKNNTAVTPAVADNSTKIATTAYVYLAVPAGAIIDYGASSAPSGWVLCDGAALSRTVTYAALFAAIGTTWGTGDGSTTFNVPDFRGRVTIGSGTATVSEVVAAGSVSTGADTFTVTSNTQKWITGQTIRMSTTVTLPAPFAAATDYFIVRASATTIKFATTLANAQNGTIIDITTQGSGNHTVTTAGATAQSYATHALADLGGEEAHAMSSTEQLSHTHIQDAHSHTSQTYLRASAGASTATSGTQVATGSGVDPATATNQNTGGNAAANVMQTFAAVTKIIKY